MTQQENTAAVEAMVSVERARLESWSQSYVLAVARATPVDAYRGGRKLTAEAAAALIAPQDWEQRSAGDGAKGRRYFHWAWIDLQPPNAGGHASLLARRNNATGEIAYYLAWTGHPVSVTDLIEVAGMRWRVEEYFQGSKELAALDEHQVRTWTSWHRWVTLAMLAFAFLALTRAAEAPPRDFWNPCSADQIQLTCNEIRHLLVWLPDSPGRIGYGGRPGAVATRPSRDGCTTPGNSLSPRECSPGNRSEASQPRPQIRMRHQPPMSRLGG